MNWYKIFYWLTAADAVKGFFGVVSDIFVWFTIIGFIIYGLCSIHGLTDSCDDKPENKIWVKRLGKFFYVSLIILLITWAGYVFTPSKKDCIMIVAGGAVGNFIQSDSSAKSLPSDITKYLHLSLNKEIDDLGKETRQELGIKTPEEKSMEILSSYTKEQLIAFITDSTVSKKLLAK